MGRETTSQSHEHKVELSAPTRLAGCGAATPPMCMCTVVCPTTRFWQASSLTLFHTWSDKFNLIGDRRLKSVSINQNREISGFKGCKPTMEWNSELMAVAQMQITST